MTENKSSSILLSITLIVVGFATLIFGTFLIYQIAIATNPDWNGVAASNTLTLTGNSSCGEWVNITNAANTLTPFYINITNGGCVDAPSNAAVVTLAENQNTSIITATNLTNAFNNNATFALTMTASNLNENAAVITYNTIGRAYNGVVTTTESLTNGAWSSSSISGGKDVVQGQVATLNYASIVMPLFGIILMLVGIVALFASIHNFRLTAGKGGSEHGKHEFDEASNTGERSSSPNDGRG